MNIGEVSNLTGISSSNIRYYEQINLIKPNRNPLNDYRIYGEIDLDKLQEIKLLRKLDVSIEDIKRLFNNEISLNECIDNNIAKLDSENKNLEIRKKLSIELKEDEDSFENIDASLYLKKIEVYEKQGIKFMSMAKDFVDKVKKKKTLPQEASYWFDPDNPIMTKEEFTDDYIFMQNVKDWTCQFLKKVWNRKYLLMEKICGHSSDTQDV